MRSAGVGWVQIMLSVMQVVVAILAATLFLPVVLFSCFVRLRRWVLHRCFGRPISIGFFHPYCNAGGGGERVLWCCVQSVIAQHGGSLDVVIYTGDKVSSSDILKNARDKFKIDIPEGAVRFIRLKLRTAVEQHRLLRPSMAWQSLGSMLLGLEALVRFTPDIYCDSMGYAFTFPIFKLLAGCAVSCYIHYPIISTDMLQMVHERRPMYNNSDAVTSSRRLSMLKYWYYRTFAWAYGFVGRFAESVMVNSSWTKNHIADLWKRNMDDSLVFPPCDCANLQKLPLGGRSNTVVSVGQFREEKDHALQLRAFALVLADPRCPRDAQLVLVGSTRDAGDEERVQGLRRLAQELGLADRVVFEVNAPYAVLTDRLRTSVAGLHTMWNEHFGISVVDYMAAGLVPIAHDSAGPRMDIVGSSGKNGFLATTPEQFAACMLDVLTNKNNVRETMPRAARASVDRFSEASFAAGFRRVMLPIFDRVCECDRCRGPQAR